MALLGHLDFGLVGLFLEPFDEAEGVPGFAAAQNAEARGEVLAGQGLLQEGRDAGDDHGPGGVLGGAGQGDEGGQAFADDIGMGQARFMRKNLPRRIKERRGGRPRPGFGILLKNFLSAQALRDDDDLAIGEKAGQEDGEKGLSPRADAVEGQHLTRLHAPAQALRSGSGHHDRKSIPGRHC